MTTFLGLPAGDCHSIAADNIVVVGVQDATPYEPGKASHSQDGPAAIRDASQKFAEWHDHYDFDIGAKLINLPKGRVVDIGEIDCDPNTPESNRTNIQATISGILGAGARPLVLGGDDSVPIPVLAAYENHEPIWVIQVDAHLDWREERFGERLGWSSPMRRASEMGWVAGMVQIGIRGVGSAFVQDVRDAKEWGSKIVTARDVWRSGMSKALEQVPQDARVFVSLDLDAIDPAFMPGVMAQSPGGLNYWHIIDLFEWLSLHQNIVGCNIVELAPQRDVNGVSAMTAARIACSAISAMNKSSR